jgi:hypothetical protein
MRHPGVPALRRPETNGRRTREGKGCDELRHCRYVASASPLSLKLVENQSADHGRNNARDDGSEKSAHRRSFPLTISPPAALSAK